MKLGLVLTKAGGCWAASYQGLTMLRLEVLLAEEGSRVQAEYNRLTGRVARIFVERKETRPLQFSWQGQLTLVYPNGNVVRGGLTKPCEALPILRWLLEEVSAI